MKRMVVISESEYLNLKKLAYNKNAITTTLDHNDDGLENQANHSEVDTHFEVESKNDNSVQQLLEKVTKYLSKTEIDKGVLLIKRLHATGKMEVSAEKVELGSNNFSLNQFIDFIQLCISRKRPHESISFQNFVTFLVENEIPLNIISNAYVKIMVKSHLTHDSDTESNAFDKKEKKMPQLKSSAIIWYKSLDEVI